jgi:hypothetical protein
VPALAEILFSVVHQGLGDRGLMFLQLLALTFGFGVLAADARASGADARAAGVALCAAAAGTLPSLAIARSQLFSLALFPVLLALLRSEARSPSRRIWLVVPLLALWSNLHGAVLIGLGVTLAYLLLERFRRDRITASAVAVAAPLALLCTPMLERTFSYYHGVLTNVAAARGLGLWSPLSLTAPFDVVLVIVAVGLALRAVRSRPRPWELVSLLALVIATVHASRSGVWMLMFLVAPAAKGIRSKGRWSGLFPVAVTAGVAAVVFACIRGPSPTGAGSALLTRATTLAAGGPILAEEPMAEQIALAGGRTWLGNPIDAFSQRDQGIYLDWTQGTPRGRRALTADIRVVITGRGSDAHRLMKDLGQFAEVLSDRRTTLFYRSSAVGINKTNR